MTKVTYVGPHTAVEVPLPSGELVIVEHGESHDFPPDFAAGLLEQPTNWKAPRGAAHEKKKGGDD